MMDIYEKMKEKWPSAVVAQTEVGKFSGGLINPRSLCNMNSLGLGPNGKYRLGRKVFYDIDVLVSWIRERVDQPSCGTGGGNDDET